MSKHEKQYQSINCFDDIGIIGSLRGVPPLDVFVASKNDWFSNAHKIASSSKNVFIFGSGHPLST